MIFGSMVHILEAVIRKRLACREIVALLRYHVCYQGVTLVTLVSSSSFRLVLSSRVVDCCRATHGLPP